MDSPHTSGATTLRKSHKARMTVPAKVLNGGNGTSHLHLQNRRKSGKWRPFIIPAVAIFLLVAIGVIPRIRQQQELSASSAAVRSALPVVELAKPQVAAAARAIYLPGTIEAVQQTAISARATGYVQKVFVDIGDRVQAGETLATITAPDTDQEVAQARAQLAQTQSALAQAQAEEISSVSTANQQQANVDLAKVTVAREKYLFDNGAAAKQDYDQAESSFKVNVASLNTTTSNVAAAKAAVDAAAANVVANQANLDRMADLQNFEKVTAPFAGIITARNVDPGAYITAASTGASTASAGVGTAEGQSSATAPGSLFSIGSMDRLRIYVSVPQDEANGIRLGEPADVTVDAIPGKLFKGTVVHTTVALDPTSRTLVAEVRLPNPNDLIRPGMFGNVHLNVATPSGILLIPDPSLLTNSAGTQVIVVDTDRKVHYQTVQVGQDNGQQVQILSGLNATQQIVASPTYDLTEGEEVRVAQLTPHKAKSGRARKQT